MTYERVPVVSDTPEWAEERRKSVGASEVPAVMGLSPYGSSLQVYKHKHGVDSEFDPVLAYSGHASEAVMEGWLREFSGLHLDIHPGFMARSTEWPFLHASFDRVVENPFLTIQMKTAHYHAGHHWDEGVPTDVRVQVQAELAVAGTRRALIVVWIGGRDYRLFWEDRDDRFINEQMIPALEAFWHRVITHDPPPVSTIAEVNEITTEERPVDLSDTAFETLERITVLNSDIKAQEEERDALKVILAQYVGTADTLTFAGQKVATWKQQKGRVGFDKEGFGLDHPHLLAKYTRIGAPFRVLRATKSKETK